MDRREIARSVLGRLGWPLAKDMEVMVKHLADSINPEFCVPVYPKPGESLAFTFSGQKTAALAFDRVYATPLMTDVPDEFRFFGATIPEICIANWGWAADRGEFKAVNEPGGDMGLADRYLCSELLDRFGVYPTIIYDQQSGWRRDFPAGPQSVLTAAISNIALVDENNLTWKQVSEFRKDKDTIRKYRRMVRWIDEELATKKPREVEDSIAVRLDDYEWSLKKHGIKSCIGALSCFLDTKYIASTSTAITAGAVLGGPLWAVLAGATLTVGQALVKFGTTMVDGLDERRKENYEIAYIHELEKRFG
jgi:hypothetical protein